MLIIVAVAAALACASVGGGLYEFSVVDPFWPKRPDLVQPARGGISRKRFWIAIHVAFEVAADRGPGLVLVAARRAHLPAGGAGEPCRHAPVVGLRLHPQGAGLREGRARDDQRSGGARLDGRSRLRLPLDLVTCGAMLWALVLAARLG